MESFAHHAAVQESLLQALSLLDLERELDVVEVGRGMHAPDTEPLGLLGHCDLLPGLRDADQRDSELEGLMGGVHPAVAHEDLDPGVVQDGCLGQPFPQIELGWDRLVQPGLMLLRQAPDNMMVL